MEIIALTTLGIVLGGYLGYSFGWRYASRQQEWMDSADTMAVFQARADRAVQQRIQNRLDRIANAAHEAGSVTNDDVEDMFCIGDRTASRYLRQLVADGRLVRQGTGRGTYYTPASNGITSINDTE